jgi:hypothetical protein
LPGKTANYRVFGLGIYAFLVFALTAGACLTAGGQGDYIVIARPWSAPGEASRIAAQAGGTLISTGRWPFIVVTRPGLPARQEQAGFMTALHRAGAVFVFRSIFSAGCYQKDAA